MKHWSSSWLQPKLSRALPLLVTGCAVLGVGSAVLGCGGRATSQATVDAGDASDMATDSAGSGTDSSVDDGDAERYDDVMVDRPDVVADRPDVVADRPDVVADRREDALDVSVPEASPSWRSSDAPFCGTMADTGTSFPIWSDSSAVYVVANDQMNTIYFNPGTGWSVWSAGVNFSEPSRLSGIGDGQLFVYPGRVCGVEMVTQAARSCSAAADAVRAVAVVSSSLAYAAQRDRLLKYDGTFWTQVGDAIVDPAAGEPDWRGARALWASTDLVVLATASSLFFYTGGSTVAERQQGVPEQGYSSVWGFSPNDIWVGTDSGALLHWNGSQWSTPFRTATGDCAAIRGMWGRDGALFFYTQSSVYEYQDSQVKQIGAESCAGPAQFTGLWGNSPREVFVTRKVPLSTEKCSAGVLWFNGTVLQPL